MHLRCKTVKPIHSRSLRLGGSAGSRASNALPLAIHAGTLALHGAHLLHRGHRDADADRGRPVQGKKYVVLAINFLGCDEEWVCCFKSKTFTYEELISIEFGVLSVDNLKIGQ